MQAIDIGANAGFCFVPSGLDQSELERVVSRRLGRPVRIAHVETQNLCTASAEKVSNSGATVLRLQVELADGPRVDLVAKILSPDAVNLFKPDTRYDSRMAEIAWAEWWGNQPVPWVPAIYGTRADPLSREFWILREHLPIIGWPGWSRTGPEGMGEFAGSEDRLLALFGQVATLHAYSHDRIAELRHLFARDDLSPGGLLAPQEIAGQLQVALRDDAFLGDLDA